MEANIRHGEGQRGFTLVELIIVLAILTLLTSLAMPALMESFHQKQADLRDQEVASWDRAAELYERDKGQPPGGPGDLFAEGYLAGPVDSRVPEWMTEEDNGAENDDSQAR
jgi:general secretion pathway protein G